MDLAEAKELIATNAKYDVPKYKEAQRIVAEAEKVAKEKEVK
jgi:hypothetical protein